VKIATMAAAAASEARVLNAEALPAQMRVSTDTRSLEAGDAFVALSGDNFDGHRFVARALERGASMLVVSDTSVVPEGVGTFVVRDTRLAYLAFGGLARKSLRAKVVAITGSVGKTTTKAFLEQILRHATGAKVLATPANENNEIGVAKLLLEADAQTDYLVVEMGARHYGEIETLTRAALPDVAVLTNIGEAHLEIFGTRERLADTKWGIFATGATAVLNADDPVSRVRAGTLRGNVVWFVEDNLPEGLGLPDVPGRHNRANAAAAADAAIALGVDSRRVAESLSALTLPSGRYERIALGDLEVIYDAYNASMTGMLATISSFAVEPAQRRIAVLSSMAELGDQAPLMHREVGARAGSSNLDALLVGGDFAGDLSRGAHEAGMEPARIVPFEDNCAAIDWLRANGRAGDLVLLKGSRRYHLEEIVEGLRS